MPKASQEFPPDEFDAVVPSRPRSPHRAPKSRFRRSLPFIAAIILGPLLAYVVVSAITTGELPALRPSSSASQTQDGGTVTPTPEPDEDDEDDEDAQGPSAEEPGTETEDEPTDEETSEEPAADPDLSTRVLVLNSTQTAGLAGRARDNLAAAGWTAVSTGNHSGALPGSTVFYAEDDPVLLATARAVAEQLGIELVELDPEQATEPITVVLERDFTP